VNSASKNFGALSVLDLTRSSPISYDKGLELQRSLHELRRKNLIPDTLVLLVHQPVITLGKRGDRSDILASEALLSTKGVTVSKTDRGGQVTFHGPGQIVGYFIVDLHLRLREVRAFVESIEHSLMDWVSNTYGIETHLESENPGIWTAKGKLAAIGISIHEKITMHGFALNVAVDPSWFQLIVPCGIKDRPAISLADFIANAPTIQHVAVELSPIFAQFLGYSKVVPFDKSVLVHRNIQVPE